MFVNVLKRGETIEECYEFMLAYAAQGLPSDDGSRAGGQVREYLNRAVNALTGLAGSFRADSPDNHLGGVTYGGYSDSIVVDEHFALRVPANLNLAGTAPLLCAGITTYSPMRRNGVGKGKKVGVVGLGGLGHMGVKFAHALGAHVVVFTTSPNKKDDGLRLGADEAVVSRNANEMQKHASSFDFILDAVSADHDINAYLNLLVLNGNLTIVGAPPKPLGI